MTIEPAADPIIGNAALAASDIVTESRDRPLSQQNCPTQPTWHNAGYVQDLGPIIWVREHRVWTVVVALVIASGFGSAGNGLDPTDALVIMAMSLGAMKLWRVRRQASVNRAAAAENDRRQADYERALARWQWTRPLNVIARADDPLRQLWAYRIAPAKMLYES